ncbi:hypothetical protein R1flu_000637 [Riccia fluitans]|uniref:Uncharacterized protein n=1 Tax=Riccia fluitans TaxID=41844 RepID=A0ABD1Y462_9MARC
MDHLGRVAQAFEDMNVGWGTDAAGTPMQVEHGDSSRAGLARSESPDEHTIVYPMLVGLEINTSLPTASALGIGNGSYYTPSRITSLPGTIDPSVPLVATFGIGTLTFTFGAETSQPRMVNLVFKTILVDEATNFADDLDEEGVTTWAMLYNPLLWRGELDLGSRQLGKSPT